MKKENLEAKMPEIKRSKTDEIFTLVKNEEGVKIAVGNYQISKKIFKSFQQAEDYLNQRPYEIIINTTCLLAEKTIKEYENKKQN